MSAPAGLCRVIFGHIGNPLCTQTPARGALPQLYAATDPSVEGGEFIGPDGLVGPKVTAEPIRRSRTLALPASRDLEDRSADTASERFHVHPEHPPIP
ncbi:hypothetical protein ACTPOK_36840 [Streptomyces inhibens]|uniref:hypothetical protein n=1 Tax=Streptomyces inhibens TaxID=2293571 RepID=UPI00402B028D